MTRRQLVWTLRRRSSWALSRLTPRKIYNMALAGLQFGTKSERMYAWPVIVKVDISPVCNLSCTVCIHAEGPHSADLAAQSFKPSHRMTAAQFKRICDEIGGRANAGSLYTWGDPLTHPDLDHFCAIARRA